MRPWPDPLPERLALRDLAPSDRDGIAYGRIDLPAEQRAATAAWRPERGAFAAVGLAGSGKSSALAAIALSATTAHPPDRVHLYVVDAGAGSLARLADLPHCGAYIAADEVERVDRVVRWLGEQIANRKRAPSPGTVWPSILLVLDCAPVLWRDATERRDAIQRIMADGPTLGIHVALSADRPSALGHAIEGLCSQRVYLRLADWADYGHPAARHIDLASLGPGRGLALPTGDAIQIAHADLDNADLSRWDNVVPLNPPTPIGILPYLVSAASLPAAQLGVDLDRLVLGTANRTLEPAALTLRGGDHLVVAGPARSGKSNTLMVIEGALKGAAPVYIVAPTRSPLATRATHTPADLGGLVDQLTGAREVSYLIVDDADLIDETAPFDRLVAARLDHVRIVAAARSDRLRTLYRHWTAELRRSRVGVLLRPDDGDGELLGVRLPRDAPCGLPGRGFVVDECGVELAQIALAEGSRRAA